MHEPPISAATGTTLKLYEQCTLFYQALLADANKTETEGMVWEGKVTELFLSLGIPQGVYGKVMTQLYHLGCITQLTVGSAGIPSRFAIHHHPSSVPWSHRPRQKDLTDKAVAATLPSLEQRVEDLHRALGGLDVVAALAEFQKRLDSLQKEVNALKTQGK